MSPSNCLFGEFHLSLKLLRFSRYLHLTPAKHAYTHENVRNQKLLTDRKWKWKFQVPLQFCLVFHMSGFLLDYKQKKEKKSLCFGFYLFLIESVTVGLWRSRDWAITATSRFVRWHADLLKSGLSCSFNCGESVNLGLCLRWIPPLSVGKFLNITPINNLS